jgi:N-acetylmuramoyl-L-alanine amidase
MKTPEEMHRAHLNMGIRSERGRTGFHFLITPDGEVHVGRAIDEVGAHSRGYNSRSVGIVLLGRAADNSYTHRQMDALNNNILFVINHFSQSRLTIVGHDAFSSINCPGFDVALWAFNKGFV